MMVKPYKYHRLECRIWDPQVSYKKSPEIAQPRTGKAYALGEWQFA